MIGKYRFTALLFIIGQLCRLNYLRYLSTYYYIIYQYEKTSSIMHDGFVLLCL